MRLLTSNRPLTSKRPLIGITTYGRDADGKFALPGAYVDAVRRAGGIPLLLPPGEDALSDLLSRLDGLILAGGGDIAPDRYGGRPHESIYMIDPERDETELALVHDWLETERPLLGICRGTQVLNVALGGTLIEHLPDVVGTGIAHRNLPLSPAEHPVRILPATKLAQILSAQPLNTASWHHQAVRAAAPGLCVSALAADGTVEAVEMPGHPWLIAVQWHPELTADVDPRQQALFNELVKATQRMDESGE